MPQKMLSKFRAEKVALSYFLFAMLWILTSDYLLGLLTQVSGFKNSRDYSLSY